MTERITSMYRRAVWGSRPENFVVATTGTLNTTHFISDVKAGMCLMSCMSKMLSVRQLYVLFTSRTVGAREVLPFDKVKADFPPADTTGVAEKSFLKKVLVEGLIPPEFVDERGH